VLSLSRGCEALAQGGDVLLMDADVLYPRALLEPLVRTPRSALLVDRACDPADAEAVKVCLRRGRVVEFRKQLPAELDFDEIGESIGFFRLAESAARKLAGRVASYVEAGRLDEPYEEPLRDLLLAEPTEFAAHDVTGIPWLEIDFPEDVERARIEILPRVEAADAGTPRGVASR
jgi:choline kinase